MFIVVSVVYLSFLTKNYYWDGIAFAQAIEGAPEIHVSLVHPNHLIYNLVGYVLYRAAKSLGFNPRSVTVLQILNAFLGAATSALLFHILKNTLRSAYIALALSLLFAFSATWWKYTVDADAYIPGALLLLLSFYLVLPGRKANPVLVGLVYALALCLHQMAIIFFPFLLVALWIQDEHPRRRRLIRCVILTVVAGGLTLGAYIYSFHSLTGDFHLRDFLRWTLSYAPDASFGFRPLINLGFTLRGHGRLFFGGRVNALSGLTSPVIVVLIIVWIGLFLVLAFQVIRNFKRPGWNWIEHLQKDQRRRKVAFLCLVWISVYVVGLYFFVAHHTYYRLFYLPALIILLGLILDSHDSIANGPRHYRLALFVGFLALSNFLTVIFPNTHVEKYPPLKLALEMNQSWPRGTVIYFGTPNSDNNLAEYFNQGTEWKQLKPDNLDMIETDLREANARGAAVWLETSAIDQLGSTPVGAEWLKQHAREGTQHSLVTKAHNIRFIQIVPSKTHE